MAKYVYRDLGVASVDRSGRPIEVLAGVTAGPAGPQGPAGPRGGRGLQGVQGVQGPTGGAGPAGVSLPWTVLDPLDGADITARLAALGMAAGDRYWLLPGTWTTVTGSLVLNVADVLVAGSRQAIIQVVAGNSIQLNADHTGLVGVVVENVGVTGGATESILVSNDYCLVEDIELETDAAATARLWGIRLLTAGQSAVRYCYLHPDMADGGIVVHMQGACTTPAWIMDNHISLAPVGAMTGVTYAVAASAIDSHVGSWVARNLIALDNANYLCGVRPGNRWYVGANKFTGTPGVTDAYDVDFAIASTEHVRVEGNEFTVPTAGVELRVAGLLDISVVGNHFYGNSEATTRGVEMSTQQVSNLVVANNTIQAVGRAINLEPTGVCYTISVTGNTIRDTVSHSINLSGGTNVYGLSVAGNTISLSGGDSIRVTLTGANMVTINGNTIYQPLPGGAGILLDTTSGVAISGNSLFLATISITDSSYFTISGNVCRDIETCIVIVNSNAFSVTGNTLRDGSLTAAMTIDTNCDYYVTSGNTFYPLSTWADASDATHLYETATDGDPLNVNAGV